MLSLLSPLIVEDNAKLRAALRSGLTATSKLHVCHACDSGETAELSSTRYRPRELLPASLPPYRMTI
jgi:hypothetical protein